jgi:hypothetical protein
VVGIDLCSWGGKAARLQSVSYQRFCSCGERGVGDWTPAHYDTPWQVCRGICTRSMIMVFASSSCSLWQVRVSNTINIRRWVWCTVVHCVVGVGCVDRPDHPSGNMGSLSQLSRLLACPVQACACMETACPGFCLLWLWHSIQVRSMLDCNTV